MRLVVFGALAAVALVAAPSAHAQTYYKIHTGVNYCLDGNSAGQVYMQPCVGGNIYQQWERWQGGWTRHRATGRCLQLDQFSNVKTATCVSSHGGQFWQHWDGGWFQRPAVYSDPDQCLSSPRWSTYVTAVPCSTDDPFNPNINNIWYVRPA